MNHTIYLSLAIAILFISHSITYAQEITRLVLVSATTHQDIRTLQERDTINLAETGTDLNVRAETSPTLVGSVLFEYGSVFNTRTENIAPYVMTGDNNGKYYAWKPAVGTYTLKVTAFSAANRQGTQGTTKVVELVVINQSNSGTDIPLPSNPGTGKVSINGELRKWHTITLSFNGPFCKETDNSPNPFLDYRLTVSFSNGKKTYVVPGYFAADGNAANTGASAGNIWRAHFSPDEVGTWTYLVSFRLGKDAAVNENAAYGASVKPLDGLKGAFAVDATNKTGRDFRGKGRLQYVGEHYLKFAETGEYFLKQGADSPENFLGYAEFDGDFKTDKIKDELVKTWQPHVQDWKSGDPTWQNGKGKGIIGAVNYLASKGLNAFSFLTMNVNGDDRNVFPFLTYQDFTHYDCSRLDQWEIVFEHAQRRGMYLHFKTQETENQTLLDGGNTTRLRKLYYRELIARFGHHLALNWNLGEENGQWGRITAFQNTEQRKAMAEYFFDHDPYHHHIVIHNGLRPEDLLGKDSKLTGYSMQTDNRDFSEVHGNVKYWLQKSREAGKPWVVACDEPGDAKYAVLPDSIDKEHNDARKNGLWGALLAGGGGNEWYFGYASAHSDLTLQNYRSRDLWWDQCRHALRFFANYKIPFWKMRNNNALTSNDSDYCFYADGEYYVILIKENGTTSLNLPTGEYSVFWYNPRSGGSLQKGSLATIAGGTKVSVGTAPREQTRDWVVLLQRIVKSPLPDGVLNMNAEHFNIYPNPTFDQLTVDDMPTGIHRILIFSVQGTLVKTIALEPEQTTAVLDVSDLTAGTYFLHLEGSEQVRTGKFIKK